MIVSSETHTGFRGLSPKLFGGPSGECTFGQNTYIYGSNGSGKTSISELIRKTYEGSNEVVDLTYRVLENGEIVKRALVSDGNDLQLHVFNRHYVQASLSGFLDGLGEAKGLVFIGDDASSSAAEIQRLEDNRKRLSSRLGRLKREITRLSNARNEALRSIQTEIIATLSQGSSEGYSKQTFNISKVKKILQEDCRILDDQELARAHAIANRRTMESIEQFREKKLEFDTGYLESIKSLLEAKPKREAIEALVTQTNVSTWVEAGMALHNVDDECRFCLEGTYSNERAAALHRHFSDEVSIHRKAIDDAITRMQAYERKIQSFEEQIQSLSENTEVVEKSEWNSSTSPVYLAIDKTKEFLTEIEEALDRKRLEPAANQECSAEDSDLAIDFSGIAELIERHNSVASNLDEQRAAAQTRIEKHFAAEVMPKISNIDRWLSTLEDLQGGRESQISQTQSSIAEIYAGLENTSHLAAKINADVREVFGHHHLSVDTTDDGKAYRITRRGEPATELSEGERNCIAYAYFLNSLDSTGVDRSRSVVVIDDPVSSLDKDSVFASYSLMQARLNGVAQVVVLTHDFDFFRLLLRVPTPVRKLSFDTKYLAKEHQSKKFSETKEDVKDMVFPRQSFLEVVKGTQVNPSYLRRLRGASKEGLSEYHYLFNLIVSAIREDRGAQDENFLLYANAGRRLLEGFIAFRAPQKESFQDRIDYVANRCERAISDDLRVRVVKYLHAGSHRTNPNPASSLDFSGARVELCKTLEFMSMADPSHFEGVCNSLGYDPGEIVQDIADLGK